MGALGTGFGVEPTKNAQGVITSGTSSKDIRWIVSGMYNQGILRDCFMMTSTTKLEYTIGSGSVVNSIGSAAPAEEHIIMPVYGGIVTTSAGGSSPRTDYVYVKQNLPHVEGNSDIVYGVMNTPPGTYDQRLVIAIFDVPANMTRTSQASMRVERNYATPMSIGGKYLVAKVDTYHGKIANRTLNDLGGSFSLHTSRLIRVDFTVSVDAEAGANGIEEALYSYIYVNGVRRATFSTGRIDHSWYTTHSYSYLLTLPAGTHNITLKRDSTYTEGPSSIYLRYSSTGGVPGQTMHVTDCGVLD